MLVEVEELVLEVEVEREVDVELVLVDWEVEDVEVD